MLPRLIAAACLALALTACGGDDEPDAGRTLEPTPSTSSPTVSESPAIGRGELPPGFPTKEVPLIGEGLVGGAEAAGEFVVTFNPKRVDTAEEKAVRLLARAGYEMVDEQEQGGNSSSVLTNGTWQVTVAASPAGIMYLVTPSS